MVRTLKTCLLVGALAMGIVAASLPASAAILTLPFIGDIEHPDTDPFHIVTPEAAAAAAPPATPTKTHRRHRRAKKTM